MKRFLVMILVLIIVIGVTAENKIMFKISTGSDLYYPVNGGESNPAGYFANNIDIKLLQDNFIFAAGLNVCTDYYSFYKPMIYTGYRIKYGYLNLDLKAGITYFIFQSEYFPNHPYTYIGLEPSVKFRLWGIDFGLGIYTDCLIGFSGGIKYEKILLNNGSYFFIGGDIL